MEERRGYTRLKMYAGAFVVRGETAYLTEIENVSAGGVSLIKPVNWADDPEGEYQLYFVLDQTRILCIPGRVIHEDGPLGFEFLPGYAIQAEQLLAESRNWT